MRGFHRHPLHPHQDTAAAREINFGFGQENSPKAVRERRPSTPSRNPRMKSHLAPCQNHNVNYIIQRDASGKCLVSVTPEPDKMEQRNHHSEGFQIHCRLNVAFFQWLLCDIVQTDLSALHFTCHRISVFFLYSVSYTQHSALKNSIKQMWSWQPGFLVGSPGTNQRLHQFTVVVFPVITGKVKQRWTQRHRGRVGSATRLDLVQPRLIGQWFLRRAV